MLQVGSLNALDLFLIVVVFVGLIIGFIRGLAPQLVSLASIWFGLLVSLWLYRPFSNNILQGVAQKMFERNAKIGSDTLAFLIMLIICFHTIRLIVRYLTKPPEEKVQKGKKKKGVVGPVDAPPPTAMQRLVIGPLTAIGSMALGIILTVLWTSIILGAIQFFTGAFEAGGVARPGLVGQLNSAFLVPYFNRVLRLLVLSVSLFEIWPEPNILEQVVDKVFAAPG
jgi:hypothetical protein